MQVTETGFKGLLAIEPQVYRDERGYFLESWNREHFRQLGIDTDFVQDNQSLSGAGVLRGLHFQVPPVVQGKLVRVINGSALDVVVDLRKSEPTFGRHFKYVLSSERMNMLWIPAGFAHGFLTLEPHTLFFYKCTQSYNKSAERALAWNDPQLGIDWGVENPIVSDKDRNAQLFKDFSSPF